MVNVGISVFGASVAWFSAPSLNVACVEGPLERVVLIFIPRSLHQK